MSLLLFLGIFRFFMFLVCYTNIANTLNVFAIFVVFLICASIHKKVIFMNVVNNPYTLVKLFYYLLLIMIFFIMLKLFRYGNVFILHSIIDPLTLTNILISLNYGINCYIFYVGLFVISNTFIITNYIIPRVKKFLIIIKNINIIIIRIILFILFILFMLFFELLFMFFLGIDLERDNMNIDVIYCGVGSILAFFGLDNKKNIIRLTTVCITMWTYGIGLRPMLYAFGLIGVSGLSDLILNIIFYHKFIRPNNILKRDFIFKHHFGLSNTMPDFYYARQINEICTFYLGAKHIGLPYFLALYLLGDTPFYRTGWHFSFSIVISF